MFLPNGAIVLVNGPINLLKIDPKAPLGPASNSFCYDNLLCNDLRSIDNLTNNQLCNLHLYLLLIFLVHHILLFSLKLVDHKNFCHPSK